MRDSSRQRTKRKGHEHHAGRASCFARAWRASRLTSGSTAREGGARCTVARSEEWRKKIGRRTRQQPQRPRTARTWRESAHHADSTRAVRRAHASRAGRTSGVATYTPAGARRRRGLTAHMERGTHDKTTIRRPTGTTTPRHEPPARVLRREPPAFDTHATRASRSRHQSRCALARPALRGAAKK